MTGATWISKCGTVDLYCGDCLEVMPGLKADSLVTDPPYGIKEAAGKNKSRGKFAVSKDYGNESWDNSTREDEIQLAMSITKQHVIFGGNYYDLPPTSCWLVWDKMNGGTDFADCELAWTNLKSAVRIKHHRWHGMIRQDNEKKVGHPTQKPLKVMEWCVGFTKGTVLDPFCGSGTTGVACAKLGRKFIGIELSEDYFNIAKRRIQEVLGEEYENEHGDTQKKLFAQ